MNKSKTLPANQIDFISRGLHHHIRRHAEDFTTKWGNIGKNEGIVTSFWGIPELSMLGIASLPSSECRLIPCEQFSWWDMWQTNLKRTTFGAYDCNPSSGWYLNHLFLLKSTTSAFCCSGKWKTQLIFWWCPNIPQLHRPIQSQSIYYL